MEKHSVVVIGGGPAGLAAALRFRQRGIGNVVVLERESEPGGVPRHCGHWGFGWESHRRLMRGPDYAARLRRDAQGLDIRTNTSVLEFMSENVMRIHTTAKGIAELEAQHVVLATGAREASRAARFIGGLRPPGIMNTGTLQQMVYLKGMKPFERPVIIGGEWVSFSSLMTCRHAGIAPVAMIVKDEKIEAPVIFKYGARFKYGVPVFTSTKVISVEGGSKVEGVEVETKGHRRMIACDGVIVSGNFVAEEALFASGPLAGLKMRGATQLARDAKILPHVSLAGNVQGPLKTAGRCVTEARLIADAVAEQLK